MGFMFIYAPNVLDTIVRESHRPRPWRSEMASHHDARPSRLKALGDLRDALVAVTSGVDLLGYISWRIGDMKARREVEATGISAS